MPKRKLFLVHVPHLRSVIDMMKHDCCFPHEDEDARKLEQLSAGQAKKLDHYVMFATHLSNPPTTGRWESFGCQVIAIGPKAEEALYDLKRHLKK